LERCTLCVNACRVRKLKKHSTMFIQEACDAVQTIVQHKPLLTRSGYWSTLQPDEPSY
jgi:hypothetical protein